MPTINNLNESSNDSVNNNVNNENVYFHVYLVYNTDHVERKVPKYEITQNKGKESENSYQN